MVFNMLNLQRICATLFLKTKFSVKRLVNLTLKRFSSKILELRIKQAGSNKYLCYLNYLITALILDDSGHTLQYNVCILLWKSIFFKRTAYLHAWKLNNTDLFAC